jgi:hypothetical protein
MIPFSKKCWFLSVGTFESAEYPNGPSLALQAGHTKVFLKREAFDALQQLQQRAESQAMATVQSYGWVGVDAAPDFPGMNLLGMQGGGCQQGTRCWLQLLRM